MGHTHLSMRQSARSARMRNGTQTNRHTFALAFLLLAAFAIVIAVVVTLAFVVFQPLMTHRHTQKRGENRSTNVDAMRTRWRLKQSGARSRCKANNKEGKAFRQGGRGQSSGKSPTRTRLPAQEWGEHLEVEPEVAVHRAANPARQIHLLQSRAGSQARISTSAQIAVGRHTIGERMETKTCASIQ